MINLQNIHKSFGSLEVLKGIDLHVNPHEVVSIVGPSGAGKTTLLQILGTLLQPDSGTINIAGVDLQKMKLAELARFRNQHIGFIFQFHQLLPEFTALENVMIPGIIAGQKHKDIEQRAKELLGFMGLTHRLAHKPNELSGGENQRVAVARALLNKPDVILADEPTGNLDPETGRGIMELLYSISQAGMTVIMSTHNPAWPEQYPGRKLQFADGKITEI
jgi:lipoprotein-releasing system ATP-binding protein